MNQQNPLADPAIQEARNKLREMLNQYIIEDLQKSMKTELAPFKTELLRIVPDVQARLEDELRKVNNYLDDQVREIMDKIKGERSAAQTALENRISSVQQAFDTEIAGLKTETAAGRQKTEGALALLSETLRTQWQEDLAARGEEQQTRLETATGALRQILESRLDAVAETLRHSLESRLETATGALRQTLESRLSELSGALHQTLDARSAEWSAALDQWNERQTQWIDAQTARSVEWSAQLAAAERSHDERTRAVIDRLHESSVTTAAAVQDALTAEMSGFRQSIEALPETLLPGLTTAQNTNAEQVAQLAGRLARMEERYSRNTMYLFVLVMFLLLILLYNSLHL